MSVAYLPFKYMTCTYEVYKPGAPQMGSRIDHLSTSLFTTFFSYLHEHPYCILNGNTTEHISGGAMNDLLITSGEPKALCTLIESARGKSLGYIIMKKAEGFNDEDIEDITDELIDRYGAIPTEIDNLLKIIKIKILSREKAILKVTQRKENVVFYFEQTKFNIDIIDKLMKKFRNRIKFSPAKDPYITFKLLNERNVLEEAIEFLENL